MSTRTTLRWGIALLGAALLVGGANAQVLYGSLTGNVTDPSGAAVPGAKVEILNIGTSQTREAETDARGVYRFTDLLFGTYKLTVKATSFATVVEDNLQISNNELRRVNVALQIAKTTESVMVSAEAIALQTDKGDVEHVISSQEVTDLPENGREGRNFQGLLYLLPGAGVPAAREANSEAGNPAGAQTLFMNGQSSQGNSTKLDGTTISYPWLPVNIAYVPPTDAIQVVNVVTNNFDAEQGVAGGASINVSIKSGTNQLHGGLFEYNQNNDMTAVNYFSHTSPLTKNVFNQYGLFIGGPVWLPKLYNGRNKLFFFFDWQDTKRNQFAQDTNLTLPTTAWRQGNFSGLSCNPTAITSGNSAPQQCIWDPTTGNPNGTGRIPFPNNTIPSNRIASASNTLIGLLPALTRPNQNTINYDSYGFTYSHRNNYDVKINYNINDKLGIWGRYSALPMDIYTPLVLGPAGGDAYNGGNPGHAGGKVQTSALGFNYAVSNTLFIDGNLGYTRQHIGADGDEFNGDYGTNQLKIPGTNGPGLDYQGIPGFQVSGFANIGNTNTGSPFLFRDNQYTTGYNITKVHGAHNLRFGFQYDHAGLNHFQPQGGTFGTARGTFGFDGYLTDLCVGGSTTAASCGTFNTINFASGPYNSWAAFLLGFPSQLGKVTQFTDPNSLRFSDYGFYARDQWQFNSRLTISYGIRWEYYPIYGHDHYGANRFDPVTDTILIGCEGPTACDTGANATKKDFAPRFGFAYRVTDKTVVRGGYGITIDPDNFRNQRNQFPSVVNLNYTPPATGQFISSDPAGSPASLAVGLPPPAPYTITQGVFTSTCANPTCSTQVAQSLTNFSPSLSTGTFQQNQDRGYIQTWNLFVQHQFSSNWVGEVGYVGSHGLRMMMQANINGSLPGTGNAGRLLAPFDTNDMNSYYPYGGTKYESLQTQMKKRFGNTIFTIAYTYSHAQDNINGDNGDGTLWRTWPYNALQSWGTSGFNRGQTLAMSSVYQLQFGKGHRYLQNGVAGQILGGWQISGTISKFSGLPFGVGSSVSCNCGGQSQSANQVNPVVAIYGGHDANTPYFDGTAFANPASNTLGNTQRNILTGPGFFDVDARVSRTFSLLKEGKLKFQLLGDAFNLTNTPSFSNPGTTFANPTMSNGAITSYNGYSVITGTVSGARQLQVGGRLTF